MRNPKRLMRVIVTPLYEPGKIEEPGLRNRADPCHPACVLPRSRKVAMPHPTGLTRLRPRIMPPSADAPLGKFGNPTEIFSVLAYPPRLYLHTRHSSREHHSPENLNCEEPMQNTLPTKPSRLRRLRERARRLAIPSLIFLAALPVYAQQAGGDPWDNAVNVLRTAFTGPIATGLSLVAIVVGGLMFAYGEGQSKKTLAGIVFGVGMAIGAVNFMAWLFP